MSTDPPPAHPPARFEPEPRPGLFVAREDVLAAIADSDLCIVNALGEAQHRGENLDYGRRGHIPGALNVPAASLVDPATHAYHDLETLRRRFAGVRETGASRAITYCGGGVSASSDAFILTLLGHDDVAVYDASMNEWGSDPSLPLEI